MQVDLEPPRSVFQTRRECVDSFLLTNKASELLRGPQIEAVRGLKRKLSSTPEPEIALVVLPTGCGKTGVAVLAPYVLNARRVLVITPSKTISKQIWADFCGGAKSFFCKSRLVEREEHAKLYEPKATLITETTQIPYSLNVELMIITAHQVGGRSRVKIDDIPSESFDLVIVDEAHHYPAPTWRMLVNHFPNSKRLFLTATPFHNGKYILNDIEPCYHLSHRDAVHQGIIRDVKFIEVPRTSVTEDEEKDAMKVKSLFYVIYFIVS